LRYALENPLSYPDLSASDLLLQTDPSSNKKRVVFNKPEVGSIGCTSSTSSSGLSLLAMKGIVSIDEGIRSVVHADVLFDIHT
jgi:hypothetical protein